MEEYKNTANIILSIIKEHDKDSTVNESEMQTEESAFELRKKQIKAMQQRQMAEFKSKQNDFLNKF